MTDKSAGTSPADSGRPGASIGPVPAAAPVHLDHATAAPLHPAAREALLAALDDGWADPARRYAAGRRARLLLDAAREGVAQALGAAPDEVRFPPSGTDAAQRAIAGGLQARRRSGRVLVTSAVEHSSVLHAAASHVASGGGAELVPVDRLGRVDATEFAAAVARGDAGMASLQSVNHEVGTRQPLTEVALACRAAGVPLHIDAAMSLGRDRVDVAAWGAELITGSARKWGGPPGIGVLVVRRGTRFAPASPEPGAENLPLALAAAASLLARVDEIDAESARLHGYTARLRGELPHLVPDLQLHGDPDPEGRGPHIVSFSCLYVDGESLLGELDRAGIAVTSGSSCTTDTLEPSHVLAAMGALTSGNLRVSVGRDSLEADIDRLLAVLPAVVAKVRADDGTVEL